MFEVNGTLVIFVISFLIFMFLLNEIMLKPIGRVMEERAKTIQEDLQAGRNAKQESERLLNQYEEDLRRIRTEAQSLITKSIDDASKKKNSELGEIASNGQVKLAQAKAEISAERAKLIDELVSQEKELVETITQKVLGEPVQVSLDATQVKRTLEEAC
jgi:F-type H+-transporting ATPase subunit b